MWQGKSTDLNGTLQVRHGYGQLDASAFWWQRFSMCSCRVPPLTHSLHTNLWIWNSVQVNHHSFLNPCIFVVIGLFIILTQNVIVTQKRVKSKKDKSWVIAVYITLYQHIILFIIVTYIWLYVSLYIVVIYFLWQQYWISTYIMLTSSSYN